MESWKGESTDNINKEEGVNVADLADVNCLSVTF